jgi:cytochrome c-type biogenesis protein CcmH/NrfG
MAEGARVFSKGQMAGAVVAALAVGFFLGSLVMEFRHQAPASTAGVPAAMEKGASTGQDGAMSPDVKAHIDELEAALAQKPGDQNGWIELGNIYFDAHQAEKSVEAYTKAMSLGPVGPDVLTDLGVMHREAGRPKQALECFNAALKQSPKHEHALYNKGVVQLHDLKDAAGAAATWSELVRVNPEAKTPEGRLVRDLVAELNRQ